jgi:hypothetical protein
VLAAEDLGCPMLPDLSLGISLQIPVESEGNLHHVCNLITSHLAFTSGDNRSKCQRQVGRENCASFLKESNARVLFSLLFELSPHKICTLFCLVFLQTPPVMNRQHTRRQLTPSSGFWRQLKKRVLPPPGVLPLATRRVFWRVLPQAYQTGLILRSDRHVLPHGVAHQPRVCAQHAARLGVNLVTINYFQCNPPCYWPIVSLAMNWCWYTTVLHEQSLYIVNGPLLVLFQFHPPIIPFDLYIDYM